MVVIIYTPIIRITHYHFTAIIPPNNNRNNMQNMGNNMREDMGNNMIPL